MPFAEISATTSVRATPDGGGGLVLAGNRAEARFLRPVHRFAAGCVTVGNTLMVAAVGVAAIGVVDPAMLGWLLVAVPAALLGYLLRRFGNAQSRLLFSLPDATSDPYAALHTLEVWCTCRNSAWWQFRWRMQLPAGLDRVVQPRYDGKDPWRGLPARHRAGTLTAIENAFPGYVQARRDLADPHLNLDRLHDIICGPYGRQSPVAHIARAHPNLTDWLEVMVVLSE